MDIKDKLERFWTENKRVIRVTKKPDKEEYKIISKVSAIGILIIGGLGFLLALTEEYFNLAVATVIVIAIVMIILNVKTK